MAIPSLLKKLSAFPTGAVYQAEPRDDGFWIIRDVPIMGQLPAGARGNAEDLGEDWLNAALQDYQAAAADGSIPSVHLEHSAEESTRRRIGFMELTRVGRLSIAGVQQPALYADLVIEKEADVDMLVAGSHPYASPQFLVASNRITSLALMHSEAPFFRTPLMNVEKAFEREEFELVETGGAVAFLSAGADGSLLYKMSTITMLAAHPQKDEEEEEEDADGHEHHDDEVDEDLDAHGEEEEEEEEEELDVHGVPEDGERQEDEEDLDVHDEDEEEEDEEGLGLHGDEDEEDAEAEDAIPDPQMVVPPDPDGLGLKDVLDAVNQGNELVAAVMQKLEPAEEDPDSAPIDQPEPTEDSEMAKTTTKAAKAVAPKKKAPKKSAVVPVAGGGVPVSIPVVSGVSREEHAKLQGEVAMLLANEKTRKRIAAVDSLISGHVEKLQAAGFQVDDGFSEWCRNAVKHTPGKEVVEHLNSFVEGARGHMTQDPPESLEEFEAAGEAGEGGEAEHAGAGGEVPEDRQVLQKLRAEGPAAFQEGTRRHAQWRQWVDRTGSDITFEGFQRVLKDKAC